MSKVEFTWLVELFSPEGRGGVYVTDDGHSETGIARAAQRFTHQVASAIADRLSEQTSLDYRATEHGFGP
jgi:hypothetical protein